MASPGTHLVKNLQSQYGAETTTASPRGGSRILFRRGCTRLLFYFNTNKPHSFFFVCRIPVVLENRRSSRAGGGSGHPLHPPPRSAPESLFKKSTIPKLKMLGPLCKQTATEDRLQNSVKIYSFYFKAQQR